MTTALPAALVVLAAVVARREWRQYRSATAIGSDLFRYSRGRLVRRMTGVGVLVALAMTLAALGWVRPRTASGLSALLGALLVEVALLVALPILDLWETARTARPEDLTRQADWHGRVRTRSRRDPPP